MLSYCFWLIDIHQNICSFHFFQHHLATFIQLPDFSCQSEKLPSCWFPYSIFLHLSQIFTRHSQIEKQWGPLRKIGQMWNLTNLHSDSLAHFGQKYLRRHWCYEHRLDEQSEGKNDVTKCLFHETETCKFLIKQACRGSTIIHNCLINWKCECPQHLIMFFPFL